MTPGDPPRLRRVRRSPTTRLLAVGLLLALVVFVADAIAPHVSPGAFVIGSEAATGLLVGVLVTLVGQSQYAESRLPNLAVISDWSSERRTMVEGLGPFWQVQLDNLGDGPANVLSVSFEIEMPGERPVVLPSVAALKAVLGDLKDGRDYHLRNVTEGAPLATRNPVLFFECKPAVVERFWMLTLVVDYEIALGVRFQRRLSLLPHEGAEPPA